MTSSSYASCVRYRSRVSASAPIASIRRSSPSAAIARTVSSSLCPVRTFGHTGSNGLRVSAITAQLCAIASVLLHASGRSANSSIIAAAGLNQCSGVTRRRFASLTCRPSAMHSSASCASCIALAAKKHSFVATSGNPTRSASAISPGSIARSIASPCRCSSIMHRSGNASCSRASRCSASASRPSASSRAIGPRVPPVSSTSPAACRSTVSIGRRGSAGSLSMNPSEDNACRFANPRSSCASSTTGSAGKTAFSARAIPIWHPMIGCTPCFTHAWLNSSAPNRLAVSAIATAGIPAANANAAIFSALIAPSLSE